MQTSHENGIKQCGFYNGHDGMFLTEGATQYTAEMLYHVSNGTNLEYREQPGTVRGASNRTPYSPLSEYQYNGNVLELLAKTMDLPLPQVLALGYRKDGRETLKNIYESMEGNQGKFDELMNNLEQIYSIDKLIIYGNSKHLQSQTPKLFNMANDDHTPFRANFDTYNELMNKTERELVATYMENHNTEYVLQHYNEIAQFLTTPELKNNFLSAIQQLSQDLTQDNTQIYTPPTEESSVEQPIQSENQNENKLTLKQKVAQFLKKNNLFMNLSFVDKFVRKQLDILPPVTQEVRNTNTRAFGGTREDFMNELTNFGQYRNLPSIQRMSDPKRLARMQRKMEENQQSNDDNERS